LRTRLVDTREFPSSLTVWFAARDGKTMQFTYGGDRLLDGRVEAFHVDELFEGPWMQSTVGTGVIWMTDGIATRILDFPHARVTDK
jgi:hypothetical protein